MNSQVLRTSQMSRTLYEVAVDMNEERKWNW